MLPEEMQRIRESGGWVENSRVNGSLALSRALGDFKFKQNKKVIAERQTVTGNLLLSTIIPLQINNNNNNNGFCSFSVSRCARAQNHR